MREGAWQSAVHGSQQCTCSVRPLTPGGNLKKKTERKREKMCQKMTSKLREQSVWQSVQLYDHPTTILHHLLTFTSTSTKATWHSGHLGPLIYGVACKKNVVRASTWCKQRHVSIPLQSTSAGRVVLPNCAWEKTSHSKNNLGQNGLQAARVRGGQQKRVRKGCSTSAPHFRRVLA